MRIQLNGIMQQASRVKSAPVYLEMAAPPLMRSMLSGELQQGESPLSFLIMAMVIRIGESVVYDVVAKYKIKANYLLTDNVFEDADDEFIFWDEIGRARDAE